MRVTSSMYFKSIYSKNNSNLQSELFNVNKQIASGLKIQYAKDDIRTFVDTMRLDNEITTLKQIEKSTQSGYKIANQTDVVLNEFESTMNRMRTLLVKAANETNSPVSLDAIAQELRTIENHLMNLSNTSINGQYLFSGSATDIKPISDDGTYMGNNVSLNSFTGSGTAQQYNISGDELFLGEKYLVRRQVTTNVVNTNLVGTFPVSFESPNPNEISPNSTIRDLMGDTDAADTTAKHHFYVRGTNSGGVSFNTEILMQDGDSVEELMRQIGNAYGNTNALKVVDVSMNSYGQFVIQDKIQGSSKIEFHMVGAVDFNLGDGDDRADISDPFYTTAGLISNLDGGETDFNTFILGTNTTDLHVKEFVKSDLTSATASVANINALLYDRTEFLKEGSVLSSSVPQIINATNKFASASTKLSEVSSSSLNGSTFRLEGISTSGNPYDIDIDFAASGSTFTDNISGNTYNIYNMGTPRAAVDGDEMSYQQLMDVMNMVITENYPAAVPGTDAQYDTAIISANNEGEYSIGFDGKLKFQDRLNSSTLAEISLYDSNSGDFNAAASLMTFNSNNAIVVRDPKTDFFDTIDKMINAVENYSVYPDADTRDTRNIGIENAIAMMDDLQDHVTRAHAQVGAQSTALTKSIERTQILEISTMTLRSSVIDTDLAEASLRLTQLSINYEAMLSIVGRISKLSLVNYL
ncbi:MAG: flagellar biosynthesis protein FlgL [Sulfurimonas sp.]|nr:flagellar biosynthesis protein FlgL [Sulfurimonas sp.]